MKNKIALFSLSLFLLFGINSKIANAQTDELIQLRNLLLPLDPPSPQPPFLFDLSAHLLDESIFQPINTNDTLVGITWWQGLHEMRYAAYDTTIIPNVLDLKDQVKPYLQSNKIPIGAFNFDYATFVDSAFGDTYNGVFYTWDDYSISDVYPKPSNPYLQKNVFMSSLLLHESFFRDVTIAIDPQFIFIDNQFVLNSLPTNLKFKADFGDGNGWVNLNYSTYNEIVINYPDSGTYLVQLALFDCDGSCPPINLSQSYIHVTNPFPRFPGEPLGFNIEGINASVYSNCNTGNKKYLILLEGVDFLENIHADELYSKSIANPKLSRLINYGYNVVVVDWVNSKWDIRSNAMRVIKLLDYLKCKVKDENPTEQSEMEQFVVIGESLGGVIGRTALAYMETEEYYNGFVIPNIMYGDGEPAVSLLTCPNQQDLREQMHNTRLFISYDSPQQGANVPIGIQHSYYSLEQALPTGLMMGPFIKSLFMSGKDILDNIINSVAVKQVLIYHYSTESGGNYTQHAYRTSFMNQLIGFQPILNNPSVVYDPEKRGYPIYCKLMTYTDGLLSGENQIGLDGTEARVGEKIVDFLMDIDLNVMKTKLNYFNLHYVINSSAGVGNTNTLLNFNALTYRYNTWGCLRAFLRRKKSNKKSCGTIDKNINIVKTGSNLIAYDSGPGGNISLWSLQKSMQIPTFSSSPVSIPIFGTSLNIGSYEYSYNVNMNSGDIAFSGFFQSFVKAISANMTGSMHTQMPAFAFIPEISSLDYDYHRLLSIPANYNSNFENRIVLFNAEKNNNATPFDLIWGFTNNTGNIMYSTNRSHCFMENPYLIGSTNVLFVNQEIGTDDLYLYSFDLNEKRNAIYSAAQNIYFGTTNPYYKTVSNLSPTPSFYDGIYSREAMNGNNKLNTYNNSISLQANNASSSFGTDLNSLLTSYNYLNSGYDPCQLSDYDLGGRPAILVSQKQNNIDPNWILYPNPTSKILNIHKIKDSNEINDFYVTIYNSLGKSINVIELNSESFYVNLEDFSEGFYIFKIQSHSSGVNTSFKILKN